jgi:pimeloyl-ACP methyl ester carboxylesterase
MELTALLTHLRSSGRAPGPVVALGVSYGAAIALRWAGEDPRLDSAVAIAPYSQLDVAIENVRADFASWVPAAWIRAGARRLPEVLGVAGEELDTLRVLARRPVPALFLAGANDAIAPPGAVEALQNVSRPGRRLWVLHGSNHEALPFRFQEMAPVVERWMDERKQSHR